MQSAVRMNYRFLWRALEKSEPEIAGKILASQIRTIPFDRDLNNIPFYFLTFCKINNLDASIISTSKYCRSTNDLKRLFIGCLISIYSPDAFKLIDTPRKGIASATCNIIGMQRPHISKMIDEAVAMFKHNQGEFRNRVNALTEKIKGGGNGT
jgi:hypothetical protein